MDQPLPCKPPVNNKMTLRHGLGSHLQPSVHRAFTCLVYIISLWTELAIKEVNNHGHGVRWNISCTECGWKYNLENSEIKD